MAQAEEKLLIVNADDFGWSTGVNQGIADAHRAGILTSATAMVNFPMFGHAAELARALPKLGVGLHLNVVHGRPLLPASRVASLLGPDGLFPGPDAMLRRLLCGRVAARELDAELSAQLDRFRETLGEPTHVDSHKHMHAFGAFVPAVVRLALKLRVPRARCPGERGSLRHLFSGTGRKAVILGVFSRRLARALREACVLFPDRFCGTLQSRGLTPAALCSLIDGLGAGTTELMCHPGLPSADDHAVVPGVAATAFRGEQTQTLQSPEVKRRIADRKIRLCHYGQLGGTAERSHGT